jgi:hypothetical protein
MKYVGLKYKLKTKNKTQKYSKLTELWQKKHFSAVLKIAAILKTCEKQLLNFLNFEALIFIQSLAEN